jgi:hypothetical protein
MGFTDAPKLDPDCSVAAVMMGMYQNMGDSLALQYGGSEAHNTVRLLTTERGFVDGAPVDKYWTVLKFVTAGIPREAGKVESYHPVTRVSEINQTIL